MAPAEGVDGCSPSKLRLGPLTPTPDWRPRLTVNLSHGQPSEGRAMLEGPEVQQLLQLNHMDMDTLLQALVPSAAKLALPYISGFYVGAVGLGRSGRVFFGCNMEFPGANLSSSVHAEQCLIANLMRHSERELVAVAISAPPCGHCRQFFSEMCCADTVRLMFGEGPKNVYRLADILPHRFGPQDLLSDIDQPLLLQKQSHSLTYTAGAKAVLDRRKGDDQFQAAAGAAFAAAASAYSPYRQTPAGVALASGQGIHSGGIVENAAFNPTLQPLQAAFAAARCAGMKDYSEVREAVLVELQDAVLRQGPSVQVLLDAVSPNASLTVLFVQRAE